MKMHLYILFAVIGITLAQRSPFLPSQQECGQVELSYRIIGGKPIQRGHFPWKVVIGIYVGSIFRATCGGSLVSKRYILTAAHCVVEKVLDTRVRIGDYDLISEYDGYDHDEYSVISHIKEDYNRTLAQNDIALAKLDREVQYNDFVKPACLPFNLKKKYFTKEKLTAIGWGRTSSLRSGSTSIIPLYTDVPVFDISICIDIHKRTSFIFTKEQNMCAGTIKNNICKGDSGSGLHYLDPSTGKYLVVGLVSTSDCRNPSTFMRISKYLQWIDDSIDA